MKTSFVGMIFLLFVSVSNIACQKRDLSEIIGSELILRLGEKGTINDNGTLIEVAYTKLVEDSRCPEGAVCVWAGRAIVEIKVNNSEYFTLGVGDLKSSTTIPYENSQEFGDYRITLLRVDYDKKFLSKSKPSKIEITIEKI